QARAHEFVGHLLRGGGKYPGQVASQLNRPTIAGRVVAGDLEQSHRRPLRQGANQLPAGRVPEIPGSVLYGHWSPSADNVIVLVCRGRRDACSSRPCSQKRVSCSAWGGGRAGGLMASEWVPPCVRAVGSCRDRADIVRPCDGLAGSLQFTTGEAAAE